MVYGYKQLEKNENVPLKNFVVCSRCGTPLTGYIVKKKNLHYYKCNKIGCKCNRSAVTMNELFENFLNQYQIDKRFIEPISDELLRTYSKLTSVDKETVRALKQELSEARMKLETIEERFAFSEIDGGIYDRVSSKLKETIRAKQQKLEGTENTVSNPPLVIQNAVKICSKLSKMWVFGDYDQKVKLQELVFPSGIKYDRQNDEYRTIKVNVIVELTRLLSGDYGQEKSGQSKNFCDLSASVPQAGIEPAHLTVHDFESCASTNSATKALILGLHMY